MKWNENPRHLKKIREEKIYQCFLNVLTKIVFVYIWAKKHLLDYIKLTNKQAKPIKILSNLGQISLQKNNPIFLSVQLSEIWVISIKNSYSSQLIWGKISRQIKAKFCPNLANGKKKFSEKRSEMEDNQQRLPFFLRIHAHSGKYHIKKSVSEIFCEMAECKISLFQWKFEKEIMLKRHMTLSSHYNFTCFFIQKTLKVNQTFSQENCSFGTGVERL